MSRIQRPPAPTPAPRRRVWRRRISGTILAGSVCVPWLTGMLFSLHWHLSGSISIDYGQLLVLPSVVITALLAPRVAYRRRDALMMFFPPWSIRFAWVIGTRLAQLPDRDWPERSDAFPVHGRYTARIAIAANRYRRLRGAPVAELAEGGALADGYDRNAPS